MLYRIVTASKIPSTFLTYQSEKKLSRGQVVEVPLRKKITTGVVIEELNETSFDAKEIDKVIPLVLPELYLGFLSLFCFNTLNDYNNTISIICSWIDKLSNKQIQNLEKFLPSSQLKEKEIIIQQTKKLEYYLDKEPWFRIRVIIRSLIEKQKETQLSTNVLIIVPELIQLDQLKNKFDEFHSELHLFTFKGDNSAGSRITLLELFEASESNDTTPTLRIILSTRTGIFLPFQSLQEIILVDEANHMYIQEQNKVYYDTRDAVFLLSETHKANLHFLSTLPSVRLYNFNSQKVLEDLQGYSKKYTQRLPKVQLYKRERKDTFQGIFSSEILEQIGIEALEN